MEPALHMGEAHHSPGLHVRRAVRKRLAIGIVVFVLAAPATVALVISRFQPEYRAEASVQVNPIRPRILYRTDENSPSQSYQIFFNTQLAVIRSDVILGRCVSDPVVSGSPLFEGKVEDPIATLRRAVVVQAVPSTQLFTVSVTDEHSQGLAAVVNTIVKTYLGYLDQTDSVAQNRRIQLIDSERKKLQLEVEAKTAALAKLRAVVAGDPNAGGGNPLRDPLSILHQALVDVRTKQSSLKARLDPLQALLKGGQILVPDRFVEDTLDRDLEIQHLTAMTVQVRRELLGAETEAMTPPVPAVEARLRADPRVMALRQEIARCELQLAGLTEDPGKVAEPDVRGPAEQAPPDAPGGSALDHATEVQRMTGLRAHLRQESAALEMISATPPASAVRERIEADSQVRMLREDLAVKELQLAVQSETLSDKHHAITNTKAAIEGIRTRIAKLEVEVREKIVQSLQREMKEHADQRKKEITAQLKQIDDEIGPHQQKAAKETRALLEGLRGRLASAERELRTTIVEDVKKEATRRAEDLRVQLKSLDVQVKNRREAARAGTVARLKEEALAGIRRQVEDLDTEQRASQANHNELKGLLAKQSEDGVTTERRSAQLKALEDDLARGQQSLQGVEQRLHELEVEAGAPGYITVASMASDPKTPEPYTDKRVKYGVVAVLGAAGLAMLVMLLLERRDDRIWSADDLEPVVGAELLGCIPQWGGPRTPGNVPALFCQPESRVPAIVAEEIKNLMAGILYPADGREARTVLVTGAAPGDGKTTLAVNLAACVAGLGKTVLLIDANFRKPDVARVFQLGNIPGLGDILAYGADPAEVLRDTAVASLKVLTAGTTPPSSVDLLGSSAMKENLDRFKSQFDYVFIDGPPLILADARVMAPLVDGVVCAFRAMESRRPAVHDALATLRRLGARTLGVVLTCVPLKHNGYAMTARALSAYTQTEGPAQPPVKQAT